MLGACGIECADGAEQQVVDTDVLPPEYLADLYQKKDADPDAGVDLPITWGPVPPIQASPASVATGPGTGYWTDDGGEELTDDESDARAPLRKELGQSMKRKTDAFRKAQLSRANLERELVDGAARAKDKAATAAKKAEKDATARLSLIHI